MRFLFVIIGIVALGAFAFSTLRNAPPPTASEGLPTASEGLPTERAATPSPEYSRHAVLRDAAGDLSVGLATQKLIGEDFMVLIDAQLNAPPKDSFYFGWLVKRVPEPEAIPLGKLERVSDASNLWRVAFRASQPFTDYAEVWVTRERKDDDEPETVLLKGRWE
jgi:hypothetical protein